jgi:hypothetical protein
MSLNNPVLQRVPLQLAFPLGVAYPPYVRENVIRLHQRGDAAESIAAFFNGRPCVRTVAEWISRYKKAPHLGPPRPLPKPGPLTILSQEDAYCLFILKCAMPTTSHESAQQFFALLGKFPSISTISREVTHRLAMSRKRVEHVSERRDEDDRVAFQCNTPLHEDRPGVAQKRNPKSVEFYSRSNFIREFLDFTAFPVW